MAKLRKISDTISRLVALKGLIQEASHTGPKSSKLVELAAFGSNPGGLGAFVYVPKDLPAGAPLVVVLHGCTQSADTYDRHSGWSTLADEVGFAILFPEQRRANNPNLCFNWFNLGDARRGSGEAESIRQMIDAAVVKHKTDRQRIFITGLSAGGAMTAVMLATYPEIFAGGAIIAGLPYACAMTMPQAFDRMRGHGGPSALELQRALRAASSHQGPWPRISVWHGSADQTVAFSNAEAIVSQWRGVHRLAAAPSASRISEQHTRTVWRNPEGQEVVELNAIHDMGHGTPLGDDGLGIAGPYMLNVGVSSTREIARGWGLQHGRGSTCPKEQSGNRRAPLSHVEATAAATRSIVTEAQGSAAKSPNVQKIIEDALRAAGLMH